MPKIVSSSEVYGHVSPDVAGGYLAGVPVGGLAGDQQAALVGNKCLKQGEAKCTYGTGAYHFFFSASFWITEINWKAHFFFSVREGKL